MQIIISLVVLGLCGLFLLWFKQAENKKQIRYKEQEDEERRKAAQATAQEFVNARDLGNNCLYTLDGYFFSFVKIEGICLELYSKSELVQMCKTLSSSLSQIKRPYKYVAVSRPADISKALQEYNELYAVAVGGQKKLLKNEEIELAEMVVSGETLERQHYIIIWDTVNRADEHSMLVAANDFVKKFNEIGINAQVLNKTGIVRFCNLVNNPAYVHIESADIDNIITVLSEK